MALATSGAIAAVPVSPAEAPTTRSVAPAAAPDDRPSAARAMPFGFIETGPELDEEPVVRAPVSPAMPLLGAPASAGGFDGLEPTQADPAYDEVTQWEDEPTNRYSALDEAAARADFQFEPLAPVLEPKRAPDRDPFATPAEPDDSVTAPPVLPRAPAPVVREPATAPAPLPLAAREEPAPVPEEAFVTPATADGGVLEDDVTAPPVAKPKPRRSILRRLAAGGMKTAAGVAAVIAGFLYVEYRSMKAELPPLDRIKNYRPPIVSEVRASDGTLLGKFHEEERYVVPLEQIPLHVRRAFLASEDASFYQHSGVDAKSIARAILKNLRSGKKSQGGSTITQQVARTFFLSPKKTIKRKLSEIMLARQMETELSKDEILHLYLNQIFFGHGAYGVEAAARIHFGKHVEELTVAEGALLAGLPQAPSRYSPHVNPDEALRRRKYVLGEMLNNGWLTKDEHKAADAEPLTLGSFGDPTRTVAPFITEQIRRELIARYGRDTVYREGLVATATIDLKLQAAATDSVMRGRAVLDRRIGYRGAPETIDLAKIDEAAEMLGTGAPEIGAETKAIVEEAGAERVYVRLAGGARGVLHRADNLWVYPVVPEAYFKNRVADDLSRVLKPGNVIRVRVLDPAASEGVKALAPKKRGAQPDPKVLKKLVGRLPLALRQEPDVEGALLSFRIPDGRVVAMVGGSDYEKSEYLIPMQAKRQVGSTFKTIVYAAALARKPPPGTPKEKRKDYAFTLASILQDAPIVMKAKEAELARVAKGRRSSDESEEQWKPGNSGDKYYGDTPLRTAYILSRNVPTLQLAQKIGIREILAMGKQLGIETPLPEDLSVALGSASLTLLEITRAHAVFPAGGRKVQPQFIEMVVNRDGEPVFDLEEELKIEAQQLIDEKVAYVMTQLMCDVARYGTASKAGAEIKRLSGGKTGTTNDYIDAWYVGFTPQLMTGVWVGYDQVKSLGVGETGAEAALPIWIDYMKTATEQLPVAGVTAPEGVLKLKIDRMTGKLARRDQDPKEIVETWFVKGTEPTELASVGMIKDEPNLFEIDPGLR